MSIGFKRQQLAETTYQEGLAEVYDQASRTAPPSLLGPTPPPPETSPAPLDKSEAAELAAGLIAEAYDLTYATFYAPDTPGSDLPLMSMLLMDASRGSRPWSLTMCPCDPDAFIAAGTYTLELFDRRRFAALAEFAADLEGSSGPGIKLHRNPDSSFTVSAPSARAILDALKNLYADKGYSSLDTQIGITSLPHNFRPENSRKCVFNSATEYQAYIGSAADSSYDVTCTYPDIAPDEFLESLPPMQYLSRRHAAFCASAVVEGGVADLSLTTLERQIARVLDQPLPPLNPLMAHH